MTRTRYTLADLLELLAHILTPLSAAVRDELGRDVIGDIFRQLIAYPGQRRKANPQPVAAPVAVPVEPKAEVVAAAVPAVEVAPTPALTPAKSFRAQLDSERNNQPADEQDVQFVRTGSGKATRYAVAKAGDAGERFTRRVVNGRARYEAVK